LKYQDFAGPQEVENKEEGQREREREKEEIIKRKL
jgi:hypothetical protein